VRDASHCPTGSPGSWIDYAPRGVNGPQHTISHLRDGSPDGRYTKSYVDGLGRAVGSCVEVDPSTSGGAQEACTATEYDGLGRVTKAYLPFFAGPTSGPTAAGAQQYTRSDYDGLGRATRTALELGGQAVTSDDGRANATTIAYTSNGQLQTTTINPRGFRTVITADPLGRISTTEVEGCGGFCVTRTDYDVASRLRSITDPAGNTAWFEYDGLGHRTQMNDPDMGTWQYGYDTAGHLTSQVDAKGQTITMHVDALGRVYWKDLPPAGPGDEDTITTFDGTLPSCGCGGGPGQLCCDDHDPATTDTCTTLVTCTHTAN
jgi:YD repeat-containing protein